MRDAFSIHSYVKGTPPRLPFKELAKAILPQHTVSLAFIGDKRARALNKKYRGKSYVPNVLSFALEKQVGEIVINLGVARKEAKSFGMSERAHIAHLFIHGCLHLKGLKHGATMESIERRLLLRFHIV